MDIRTFCQELSDTMPHLVRGFFRHEHQALRQGTITPVQLWGLDYLLTRGACSMTDFARYFGTTKPSATSLVDRLIEQGLVLRASGKADRRVVNIALTNKGKKLVRNIKTQRQKALCSVFGRISDYDRREYLRILKEVIRSLDEPKGKGQQL